MISLAHLDVGTRVTPSSTGEPPCTRGRPTGNGHHGMPPTSTMIGRAAICTTIAVAAMMTLTACAAVVTVVPGSTRRICELTGEDSINRTETRFKLRGTDLGASFQGDELTNVIYFLFGDTVPVGVRGQRLRARQLRRHGGEESQRERGGCPGTHMLP